MTSLKMYKMIRAEAVNMEIFQVKRLSWIPPYSLFVMLGTKEGSAFP